MVTYNSARIIYYEGLKHSVEESGLGDGWRGGADFVAQQLAPATLAA